MTLLCIDHFDNVMWRCEDDRNVTKKRLNIVLLFWIFSFLIYTLLLVQVRRYRDGSDWFFFTHLTKQLLSGNWANIYSELEYGQYRFYYSPLSLFLLAPVVWTSDVLRLAPIHQQIVNIASFAIFDLFMAWSAVRLVRVFRALSPWEEMSIAAFSLFSYFTLMSSLYYGRFESVMLVFLFEGTRASLSKQFRRGSVFLILAILVKQTAVFALVPLVIWLAIHHRKNFYELVGIFFVMSLLIFSPFLLNDTTSVSAAMLSQAQVEVRGFTIWHLGKLLPFSISGLVKFSPTMILVFHGFIAVLTYRLRKKLTPRTLLTLTTFSVVGTMFLMPTVLSYYLLFPIMMLFLWEKSITGHPVATFVFLGVALMVHSLGFSQETMVYSPGVLTSTLIVLTYAIVFFFIKHALADILD